MTRAFCPTCRTMREVMDEYLTDDGQDPPVERLARPLECGHDADDGGGSPYRPRPPDSRRTQELIARVVELQKGQGGE